MKGPRESAAEPRALIVNTRLSGHTNVSVGMSKHFEFVGVLDNIGGT